jgi:hypothetical protein
MHETYNNGREQKKKREEKGRGRKEKKRKRREKRGVTQQFSWTHIEGS